MQFNQYEKKRDKTVKRKFKKSCKAKKMVKKKKKRLFNVYIYQWLKFMSQFIVVK